MTEPIDPQDLVAALRLRAAPLLKGNSARRDKGKLYREAADRIEELQASTTGCARRLRASYQRLDQIALARKRLCAWRIPTGVSYWPSLNAA